MNRRRGTRKYRALWVAALLLLLLAAGAVFFRWQQTGLQTQEIPVSAPGLPAPFEGLRVTVVSDLHCALFGEDSGDLLRAVAGQKPDLIAVTGDLVDQFSGDFSMVPALARGLADIAPTYYVTGNHEWSFGTAAVKALKQELRDCGVTVLSNEYVTLEREGETLVLAGIDDPNGYADQKTLHQLTREIRDELGDPFILLLAHRNTDYHVYDACGVDVTLCGHGHGGLIRLPFTDGLLSTDRSFFPDYTAGLYQLDNGRLVVSRGLGNSGPSFRLFNRPHLPVVVLGN